MRTKLVPEEFKWRHHEPEIILYCVRWYLRYSLSYRDLAEMMQERGLEVVHTTIYRWILHYAPEWEKRVKYFLKTPNGSWRTDETYIKIRGKWHYLYNVITMRGLYLSNNRPVGICMAVYVKKNRPDMMPKPKALMLKSCINCGAITLGVT